MLRKNTFSASRTTTLLNRSFLIIARAIVLATATVGFVCYRPKNPHRKIDSTAEKERNKASDELKSREDFFLKLSRPTFVSANANKVAASVWFRTKFLTSGSGTKYFEMGEFHPMISYVSDYKIYVRESYEDIFDELMLKAQSCLIANTSTTIVVTGNPGIGKSFFYLYCMFRMIQREADELVAGLPPFRLVINCKDRFYVYSKETKHFYEVKYDEQTKLREQKNVIRLIDGDSSSLTGWKGISILFSSPGNSGINEFLKTRNSSEYIMPVWDYDELTTCNEILENNKKMPNNILQDRYDKFGGIPRYVYEDPLIKNDALFDKAVNSFNAIEILNYVQSGGSIRENIYSHRILKMVPIRDNYSAEFYIAFQSKVIAEKVFSALTDNSLNEFRVTYQKYKNDKLAGCAVLVGGIYEMLCHRNFEIGQPQGLQLRSLSSNETLTLDIPAALDIVTFKNLSEINLDSCNNVTYFRPISDMFGGLDAFIVDPWNKSCYGLQMTINKAHGIKVKPMETFLAWLDKKYTFAYVFLTPPDREKDFQVQNFLTTKDKVYKVNSRVKTPKQFVCTYDILLKTKI